MSSPLVNEQKEIVNWLSASVRGGENVFPASGDSPQNTLNAMLRQNIVNCSYYREMNVRNFYDLVAEVERSCTHAEPWAPGG